MRIKDLSLIDYRSSVKIDRVSFDRLNVLVGVSGAGKTTIISGLKKLITIAEGEKAIGLEWELSFLDDLDREISWIGKLSQGTEVDSNGKIYSKFINELLTIDGKTLFSRNEKEIIFSGMTLPRLDEDKSLLFQFRSSDELKAVFNSLVSTVIVSVDSDLFSNNLSVPLINRNIQKEVLARKGSLNINKLSCQYNELTCREKLYYAYKYDKESFEDFVFTYTNIFPNVRKIIPTLIKRHVSSKDDGRIIFIDIEMKDGKKVPQGNISSGMFKAMMILSELLMGNNNSPIIIDEIENSLGVNCLPDILSELQTAQNQVIITSHHPRVINDISKNYWKVVSREKNGNIRTYPANEVLDFESNHDNFLLLLNSSIYRGRS